MLCGGEEKRLDRRKGREKGVEGGSTREEREGESGRERGVGGSSREGRECTGRGRREQPPTEKQNAAATVLPASITLVERSLGGFSREGCRFFRATADSLLLAGLDPPPTMYFRHQGKCVANIRSTTLDFDAPKELLNADVMHRMSVGRRVQTMSAGRFSNAPRKFFGEEALRRTNEFGPQKLYIDPYHVGDGNLYSDRMSSGAPNVRMNQYQIGGQACKAARGKSLVWEKEKVPKMDAASRARSRYVEPPVGRFVPALKPWCKRSAVSLDPYNVGNRTKWVIEDTGLSGGLGSMSKTMPVWSTHSLARRQAIL